MDSILFTKAETLQKRPKRNMATPERREREREREVYIHICMRWICFMHRFRASPYQNMEESKLHSVALIPLTTHNYYTFFVKVQCRLRRCTVQQKKNGGHGAIKLLWRRAGVTVEYGIGCAHIARMTAVILVT